MLLIPARNEGPRVGGVVVAARGALPGVPVVVVVNGCTDDTARRAADAGTSMHRGLANVGYAVRMASLAALNAAQSPIRLPTLAPSRG